MIPPNTPLLNLPRDILFLFLNHLTYTDILSLSLTTKGLSYITPTESTPGWPGRKCVSRLYQTFLSKPHHDEPASVKNNMNNGYCPYCTHPLCPPTCPSAIILDSKTGIFYPKSLYPYQTAVPASSTSTLPESAAINYYSAHFSNQHDDYDTEQACGDNYDGDDGDDNKPIYKTIWCNHHRCPQSLLHKNFHSNNPETGASRLYHDYSSTTWKSVRKSLQNLYIRYRIPGFQHRLKNKTFKDIDIQQIIPTTTTTTILNHPPPPSPICPTTDTFFDELCTHCRLPVYDRPWSDRKCTCCQRYLQYRLETWFIRQPEPCRCDLITVKTMLIKAFEIGFKRGGGRVFYFGLAVEVRVGKEDARPDGAVWATTVLKMVKPGEVRRAVGLMAGNSGGGGLERLGFEEEGVDGYMDCEKCRTKSRDWEVDLGC
ncbi:hypothetical protein TWF106_000882 [Orbilia oligospora]|uniref:F-box domain-containing protein n=2 Tax=Orbilia oligospora TaxID=2813651 RepID=A0A7C8QBP1_ORBOL|nr:hypothetical protein TWF679_009884 [Orbilia oligospora]KAF3206188.1 hypothetical protein TWF106_000882 [Orbilia oligospora]